MTVRNVKKNLAGQQDLLPGVGPYNQIRRGMAVVLDGPAKSFIRLWKSFVGDSYAGTFEDGCTVLGAQTVVVSLKKGEAYEWTGAVPGGGKVLLIDSTPEGSGGIGPGAWVLRVLKDENPLRSDLAALSGASLIGAEEGTVDDYIGDRIVVKATGTAAGDKAAIEAGIATGKIVSLKGAFTLDNSAGPALTIAANDVVFRGPGSITATAEDKDLILVTGNGFVSEGVKYIGPGTYRPDLGATGAPPALLKIEGDDASVEKNKFVNPSVAGVFLKQSCGSRVVKNIVTSLYAGAVTQPFLFHVYLRVTSDTLIYGNTLLGGIQGICGGGDGSGALTVVGKNGLATSNVRNTIASFNQCAGQLDHSIYFSNNTTQTTVTMNQVESVNDLIKVEGGPNIVTNNRGVGGSGITGRNVFNTLIDGNSLITTLSSTNAYGILLYEQQFKRPANDITISNNNLTCIGTTSKAGIYVIGEVWDGYQSVISNLTIEGNNIKNYGNTSEGFGIGVRQQLFAGSPVTGELASGVNIANNTIEFPIHVLPTYGIVLSEGVKSGCVSGNIVKNFRSQGLRSLGVQDMSVIGNTFIADPSVSGIFCIFERAKDLATHYNSQGNRYSGNTFKGSFARLVNHSDETCINADRVVIRRTGALSSDTVIAAQWPKQVVYNNHTSGAVITIDALTTAPWPVDSDLTITNAGASNSLTVNPGGFSVGAGTSLRLVGIGSNAWIKAN